MDHSDPQARPSQRNGSIKSSPLAKRSKACVSCRARKVKCDADVVGLPCSSCTSRQCPETCVLSLRKPRRRYLKSRPTVSIARSRTYMRCRKLDLATAKEKSGRSSVSLTCEPVPQPRTIEPASATSVVSSYQSRDHLSDSRSRRTRRSRSDIPYLNMIQDAVNSAASGEQLGMNGRSPSIPREEEHNDLDSWFGNKPPGLDDVDYDYLVKKRVFELPAQPHLDTLIRTYFEYLWPFAPIICRADFIQRYRAGNCSLFLLYAILATTVPFAPEDAISGLGFQDRSTAQTSFFTKSRLLYDFHCERDLLAMLQGSIVLSIIILDYPTDKDFQHWFYNSIRLFVKLDVPEICSRQEDSCKAQKLYRRIWWVLYDRDVFHSFVNTRNLRLLEILPYIKPVNKSDWEEEDTSERHDLLEPISDRQKTSLVAHCELAQIFSTHPLNTTSDIAGQDPLTFMLPLEEWRMSLAERMGIRNQSYDGEAYYPEVMARSYLFECILCRHFRRRQEVKWGDWAKQRLRSAIFELDAIVGRVLASGTIKKFPMGFRILQEGHDLPGMLIISSVATVPALLALHIEMALDLSETELARSMARVSINQTMLALGQMQHVPAIKRGLPAFESVLAKKDLYQATGRSHAEKASPRIPVAGQHAPDDGNHPSSVPQPGVSSADPSLADYPSFPEDFLGYDFLDRWQLEQWEFIHI
ncbi:unnamed protein product [Clonostachys rhizophaga]|uniref:Zn(2)-C6 fungal-type domain-containing protein n=1 Tax=Clonostachys rhizophaga TaxID=160324 RepID=A0A9N9YP41_9HYPO|nr:unnamed protein product [Clonostachys rhizophaga]